ncbi:hypothetical protein AB4Z46_30780 [Variovorax sp. M-6]|uniref:hypothetical protein n=1 Tax=Variovorax sp. M-6 TaxID=3233041 RepID=UPI003F986044
MDKRNEDVETVPHRLDSYTSRPKTDARKFANAVASFFRKSGGVDAPETMVASAVTTGQAPEFAQRAQAVSQANLYRHWDAIKAEGITASQFIAFLQPLADLDGITVSYAYSDEDGQAHVYNRRREDASYENPLSHAIRDRKVTKEKALTFALNEEGKVWIESNFIELK